MRTVPRNIGLGLLPQSGLMLAARINLPHFSFSSAMNLPKSAGEVAKAVEPDRDAVVT
jgi:hypothetical protein